MASSDDEDDLLAQAVAEMEAKERGYQAPLPPKQQVRPVTPPLQTAPVRAASVAPAPVQASPIPSRGPSPTPAAPALVKAPAAQASRDQRQQVSSPVVQKIKSWGSSMVPGRGSSRAPSRAAAPPPPSPPQRDDDEESEVEMLSISSEEGYEPVAPPGGARPSAGVSRQNEASDLQDLDAELDDEDDATTWKQVSTEELADRALNVRFANRAAHAEKLTSRTLRRMSNIDTERLDNLQDPLGLGNISLKTMTLARAGASASASPSASESSRRRGATNRLGSRETSFGQDDFGSAPPSPLQPLDPADREKLLVYSEKFDPQLYLARFHRETLANELELGERALKADLQNRKEQLKKLVKDNFDCFISCKNTIDDIHSKLQQIESDREGAGTLQLSQAIEDVDEVAKRAFKPLLERQAQAERIRSVQGVLQRFRTLFNLPSAIRTHIKNKEYDLVVREYKKAKSLIMPSKAGILQNVLEEVDKVVAEFKGMLTKSLESPSAQPAEVERTIKLLLELEPNSDPIWHYLQTQERRIGDELESVAAEHDARMEAFVERVREKVQAEARWQQLQKDQTKGSQVDLTLLLGSENGFQEDLRVSEAAGEEADALLGRQIRRLTAVIVKHVPNFWRLWLAIYSGKFAKANDLPNQLEEQGANGQKAKAVAAKFPSYYKEDEKDSRYTKHPQEEVEQMVLGILGAYETKVQSTFMTLAEATVLRPYMREAVLEVAKACSALKEKDCAPHSAVQAMLVLRTEVTRVFVLRLCTLMRGTTRELSYEEDWVPVPTAARNLTPYAVSAFPLRFGDMLTTALDHVADALPQGQLAEFGKDEALESAVRSMQDSVRSTFFDCFQNYTECLTKMHTDAVASSASVQSPDGLEGTGPSTASEGEFALPTVGRRAESVQQKIMLLLSNSAYVRTFLVRELVKQYQSLWTPSSLPAYTNPATSPTRPHRGAPRPDYEKQLEEREAAAAAAAAAQQDLSGATGVAEVSESLSALEERLLEDYLERKAALLGPAVTAYLLEDNTPWGQAPPVKGLRDAVLELLHPLVAVHAEVHACARPFVGKAISVLAESLVAFLRSSCRERIRTLDANGYAQLMLEVDYLDIVLAPFATDAFEEAVAALRAVLQDKVLAESTPGHSRRTSRADSVDELDLGDTAAASPAGAVEEAQAAAKAANARFLEPELKRTRINVICFKEGGLMEASGGGLTPPPHARPAPAPSQSRARPSSQTPNGWQPPLPAATSAPLFPNQSTSTPPPGAGSNQTDRQHRRTSSLSSQDSDVSDVYRQGSRLPPRSPVHQAALGYEGDGLDTYGRSTPSGYSVASSNRQAASSRTGWSSRRPTDAENLT